MDRLPESLYVDYSSSSTAGASSSRSAAPRNPTGINNPNANNANAGAGAGAAAGGGGSVEWFSAAELGEIEQLIRMLNIPLTRPLAITRLTTLYKANKPKGPELGFLLWYSPGTTFSLLQEFFRAYRLLSPLRLSMADSTRICNVLLLIQCMASHPEVRMAIIRAQILVYFYPLMNTSERVQETDYMRVSGLGVITSLVKEEGPNTPQIVQYLLENETIAVIVHCMDVGSDLTKSLAALVLGKILAQGEGKTYFGTFVERFFSVSAALSKMVDEFTGKPSTALLKNILICYLRLSEIPRCCDALTGCFPVKLRDRAYLDFICDERTRGLANQVLNNIMGKQQVQPVTVENLMAAGLKK